jgi:hypothetical protein
MQGYLKRCVAAVALVGAFLAAGVARATDTVVTPATVTFPDTPVNLSDLLGSYLTKFGTTVALMMGAALIVGLVYKGWRWVKRM